VCNKQLACHSCTVHIVKNYDKLDKPAEAELDVHCELAELYRENSTRMSCQIILKENMNGMEVEIPRSAFFLFNNDTEEEENKFI
jgi:ferredoxin